MSDSVNATGYVNGKPVFTVSCGCRIETGLDGTVKRVMGINRRPAHIRINTECREFDAFLEPNAVIDIENGVFVPDDSVKYYGD